MPVPIRLLRAQTDDMPGARPRLSAAEQDREAHILASATNTMARYGRAGVTLYGLATAIRISPATIRRHFTDLDSILAEILYRHLAKIAAAIGEGTRKLPQNATVAQRRAARRAAYIAATRGPLNAPTEAQILLIRERHVLPADLAEPIEALRMQLGEMLAGDDAEAALALLDTSLPAARIEEMLDAPPRKLAKAPPTFTHIPPSAYMAAPPAAATETRNGPS